MARCVNSVPRRPNAQRARTLLRIDPDGELTRFAAGLQQAQGFWINPGMAHVQFEDEVVPEGIGSLHHDVESLDAVNGDVALGEDPGFGVVEVYADKNAELFGQGPAPSLRGCDAAAREAATRRPVAALQQPSSG
jgi:hypothetical protein